MTASLYQSGSGPTATYEVARRRVGRATPVTGTPSPVVLELGFRPHPRPDVEDRGRRDSRVEVDPVARPLPEIRGPLEELLGLVRGCGIDPELVQRQLDDPTPRVVGIEVDDGEDHVGGIRGPLRVGDEPIVADRMERQSLVRLQGAVLAA